MADIPMYVNVFFIVTTLATIIFFYFATNRNTIAISLVLLCMAIQTFLGYTGFYHQYNALPPRVMFMILPSVLLILY
jgi:hypothetical protein